MSIAGHQAVGLWSPLPGAAAGSSGRAGRRRAGGVGLLPGGAPAASEPVFVPQNPYSLQAGRLYSIGPDAVNDCFDNAGTNARITDASFSTTECFDEACLSHTGRIHITTKTYEELNALPPPPHSPFTVAHTVTMTNDEGETASGTLTFETTCCRPDTTPEPPPAPIFVREKKFTFPAGVLVIFHPGQKLFDHVGTNPRFTDAVFSSTEYCNVSRIRDGRLSVKIKSDEELRALPAPPANPFSVTVTVTMVNDEGHSASGTLTLETWWDNRNRNSTQTGPEQPTSD